MNPGKGEQRSDVVWLHFDFFGKPTETPEQMSELKAPLPLRRVERNTFIPGMSRKRAVPRNTSDVLLSQGRHRKADEQPD